MSYNACAVGLTRSTTTGSVSEVHPAARGRKGNKDDVCISLRGIPRTTVFAPEGTNTRSISQLRGCDYSRRPEKQLHVATQEALRCFIWLVDSATRFWTQPPRLCLHMLVVMISGFPVETFLSNSTNALSV